jgi:hypothetical protein
MLNFVLWLTLLIANIFGTWTTPAPYPTCGNRTCGVGASR